MRAFTVKNKINKTKLIDVNSISLKAMNNNLSLSVHQLIGKRLCEKTRNLFYKWYLDFMLKMINLIKIKS